MPEPPRLAECLLRWLVGGRDADAVSGDLRETFGARGGGALWYWRQALSCVAVRISGHRRVLPGLGMDFHHALRTIRRSPGYALTAMFCLALAMGVNTTLFSLVDSVFFRKLPVPDAGRILNVQRTSHPFCTWREYLGFRDSLRSVHAASTVFFSVDTKIDRRNFLVAAECVSGNFNEVLQPGLSAGRWFASDSEKVAVLSYGFWRTKLNADPAVLGKQLTLFDQQLRVIGIGPAGFRGAFPPFASDLWIPTDALPSPTPSGPPVGILVRLSPGFTQRSAEGEFRVIDAALRADPRSPRANDPAVISPVSGVLWRRGRRVLTPVVTMMSILCGVVLLIACVNVANLLLSRAAVRNRELAIRSALGASRWRLFRARLVESLLLAAGATALGMAAGEATGRALEIAMPSIPEQGFHGLAFGVDWRVTALLAATGFIAALLFTLGAGGGRTRRRQLYSIAQVGLSLTLLIATGLLLRALHRVETADPGFATDHRLSITLYGPPAAFNTALDRVRAVPGVEAATLSHSDNGGCAALSAVAPPRRVSNHIVEPNYFEMMRVPILRGSGLSDTPGVVVNETMARAWWPGEDPLGKPLWLGCDGARRVVAPVVGVVRDITGPLDVERSAACYVNRRQASGAQSFSLIALTAADPYQWSKPLVDTLSGASQDLHIYEVASLADTLSLSFWEMRWQAALLGSLGGLAIVLAAIGLYGVVACSVAQRTREIGVRMAIGAQPVDVQWMFLASALRITAVGVAAGLALSAATVRFLRAYLYGLSPFDPIAFAGASLAWVLIAMLASWWPARRATHVDPLTALKYE